ncbi:MAG: hypothetical protein AMS19_12035 [Gemmatimonas sp. SG8_23]|jgi:hypothetical protein|nr:MAG: hypothetical protein AMS19_12035 [Gemmatimonas sp. SG8_23]
MLLLGFWTEADAEGEPAREALVVGRSLDALTGLDLERAFAEAAEPAARSARPRRDERRRRRT